MIDAFWFIDVSERFDQPTAERLNEKVWGRVAGMAAKDIRSRFEIKEKGLKGFVKTLRYFTWTIPVGYQIEERADEVIITVPNCPTQEARPKMWDWKNSVKETHRGEFIGFAKDIDERIQIECFLLHPTLIPRICSASGDLR